MNWRNRSSGFPRGRSARPRALILTALCWLASFPVRPQTVGGVGGPSIASDQVPLSRTIPEREQVRADMDRSRLRLGPVRILPSIAVTNAGYDSNVFGSSENPVGDWTATVAAGLRLLVPFGPKVYFRADAFPQYTWYDQLKERDQFGGLYDASLLGFFNRVSAEATGSYAETYSQYSTEVDSRVFQTSERGTAKLELDISPRWSVFGKGEGQRVRYQQIEGPPLQDIGVRLNDRTDTGARGGLRYHVSPVWNVAAVVEGTWADFVITPELRNNRSTAYLASVQYDRPLFYVNLTGGYREGQADSGMYFPDYATGVGSFFLSWFPIRWLEVQGNGHRRVSYSITVFNPYYFEDRIGGRLNVQVVPRVLLSGYGEVGPNEYPRAQPVDGTLVKRRDQSSLYGGSLSVLLVRQLVLSSGVTRSVYDSNIPGDSRAYTRFTATLSFSGELQR